MRISILACIMTLALSTNVKSQCGIYLTASDFTNKQLSYSEGSKIHLNNSLMETPYVAIVTRDKKIKLNKNEIFGYVDGDKKAHRFYKNEDYVITEEGPITVYMQVVRVAQSKGYVVLKKYYFSKTPGSEITSLNIHNLKDAYRGNEKFIDLLDQYIDGSNAEAYDELHNTFRVNYVYTKTLKESSQNLEK